MVSSSFLIYHLPKEGKGEIAVYLSDHSHFLQVLSGKYILRFAVGAPLTEERHVIAAWKVLQDESTSLLGSSSF